MKSYAIRLLSIMALACASGMVSADPWKDESGHGRGHGPPPGVPGPPAHARGSYFHEHGYTRLDIPPGHLPPPGECRAWFPDRPPGHQPPPGSCGRVPPGAWLIRHPLHRPEHVYVTVYERETVYETRRPRRVLAVGEFEIGSGTLARVILER